MGGTTIKVTELTPRNAKPGAAAKRLADGGGWFLDVGPNGSKFWRMAYRYGGKQKLLALGVYPNASIAKARKSAQPSLPLPLPATTHLGTCKQLIPHPTAPSSAGIVS